MRDVTEVKLFKGGGAQMIEGVMYMGEDNFLSRSMLASVTLHEIVHNQQDVSLRHSPKGELDAIAAQIAAFDRFNNTPEERKFIQSRYDEYYKLVYPEGAP